MKNFLKFLIKVTINFILIVVISSSIYKISMNGEGFFVMTDLFIVFFLYLFLLRKFSL